MTMWSSIHYKRSHNLSPPNKGHQDTVFSHFVILRSKYEKVQLATKKPFLPYWVWTQDTTRGSFIDYQGLTSSSSSSKSPFPPLNRPPREPNGEKSSSVSFGGPNKLSSSSNKQKGKCFAGGELKDGFGTQISRVRLYNNSETGIECNIHNSSPRNFKQNSFNSPMNPLKGSLGSYP